MEDLNPIGVLEELLVDDLISNILRRRRVLRYETGAIKQRLEEAVDQFDASYIEHLASQVEELKVAVDNMNILDPSTILPVFLTTAFTVAEKQFQINIEDALPRIHRRTSLGTVLEEASGCSSESGIMVLEQKPARKQGAPK